MRQLVFLIVLIAMVTCGHREYVSGKDGADGQSGAQGTQGLPGTAGVDGKDGAKGDTGVQGVQGNEGSPGPQGAKGEKGDTGADGAQGTQGVAGTPGLPGPQGEPGEAATPTASMPVSLCPSRGPTSYPSNFPEYGLCIEDELYAVYWTGSQAFLAKIVPGTYASTSPRGCNFVVGEHCQVLQQ